MKGLLKMRPAWGQFLVLIGVAIVSMVVFGLMGTVIMSKIAGKSLLEMSDMAKWDYTKDETVFLLRGYQVVQFISLFIIPVFLCAWLFSTDSRKYLGLKAPSNKRFFIWGVVIMIISIPLINLLGELNQLVKFPADLERWIKKSEADAAKTVSALLSRHTIKDLLLNLFCIAGLAAVGEELLFRGMAQRLLIKMFKNPWTGIIVASVLFSAMHVQFYGFLPRFALGVFLGMAYWYSGSLWVSMLGHFVYDGLLIVLSYYYPEMIGDEQPVKISSLALVAAVSAVLVAVISFKMKKDSTVTYEEVYADDAVPVKDHPF